MAYCCSLDIYLRSRKFDFSKHLRTGTPALYDHQSDGSGFRLGSVSWYRQKDGKGHGCNCWNPLVTSEHLVVDRKVSQLEYDEYLLLSTSDMIISNIRFDHQFDQQFDPFFVHNETLPKLSKAMQICIRTLARYRALPESDEGIIHLVKCRLDSLREYFDYFNGFLVDFQFLRSVRS